MTRILLIGANGQLGSDLRDALTAHTVLAASRTPLQDSRHDTVQLDVTEFERMRDAIATFKPGLVLNCSAFHRVDDIEKDASQALHVNALTAQRLALMCREADCALMHISTDYVYDGAKRAPYVESDLPNPLSAYGASKLAGELLIRAAWPKHFVIRTCGLYGHAGASGKGGNFVNTMLRLAREHAAAAAAGNTPRPLRVVADQTCTPTFTKDLAAQLAELAGTDAYGLFHVTSAGSCTWHEFANTIFELAGLDVRAEPVTSAQFNAPAVRPPYSVLENARLQSLGIDRMRGWREALREYLSGR
jgi:dTDP-4-dehydrorhamnose reductase